MHTTTHAWNTDLLVIVLFLVGSKTSRQTHIDMHTQLHAWNTDLLVVVLFRGQQDKQPPVGVEERTPRHASAMVCTERYVERQEHVVEGGEGRAEERGQRGQRWVANMLT